MSGYVDLATWKHREHYELFRQFAQPFFSTCSEIDVSELWARSRAGGGISFFLAGIYAVLQAANEVEAFRLRLRDDGVWRHDRVALSSTVLRDDETFGFGLFELRDSYAEFAERGREMVRSVKNGSGLRRLEETDAVVFHSTLRWIRFTSFSNALPLGGESTPRIVFGRCGEDGRGRVTMPVAVEVHHALVHGIDVARFLDSLQAHLNAVAP